MDNVCPDIIFCSHCIVNNYSLLILLNVLFNLLIVETSKMQTFLNGFNYQTVPKILTLKNHPRNILRN